MGPPFALSFLNNAPGVVGPREILSVPPRIPECSMLRAVIACTALLAIATICLYDGGDLVVEETLMSKDTTATSTSNTKSVKTLISTIQNKIKKEEAKTEKNEEEKKKLVKLEQQKVRETAKKAEEKKAAAMAAREKAYKAKKAE